MPDFPAYYGSPLPKVLNPLNPYHYWLVLTWLYFRPSHLKHYLYQADPELYRASGFSAVKRSLQTPVYRNLYFIRYGVRRFVLCFHPADNFYWLRRNTRTRGSDFEPRITHCCPAAYLPCKPG